MFGLYPVLKRTIAMNEREATLFNNALEFAASKVYQTLRCSLDGQVHAMKVAGTIRSLKVKVEYPAWEPSEFPCAEWNEGFN